MKDTPDTTTLTQKAVGAMKAAVAKVVAEHARTGRPLAVWRDGKVAMIPAVEATALHEAPGAYNTEKKLDPQKDDV